ncbi:hypothetical protein IT087_01200 [Candidatus Uhrbacteria bacterium]|nr:hypothetical protein [Candidatus Uhrbacteria bacterium]
MSFQRMLEMVRRQGMPLMVTDPDGREPMVVLPLEVYEALVEGGSAPAARAVPKQAPVGEPIMVPVRDGSAPQPKPQIMPELLAELSMEERFYIEPLDESKNS